MVVKKIKEDTINDLGEDSLYNLRRTALSQGAKNKICNVLDNKCELCGRNVDELSKNQESLHVHHIRPIKDFSVYEDPNTPDNIIVLCNRCHNLAHKEDKESVLEAQVELRNRKLAVSEKLENLFEKDVTQYVVEKQIPIPPPPPKQAPITPPTPKPDNVTVNMEPEIDFIAQIQKYPYNPVVPAPALGPTIEPVPSPVPVPVPVKATIIPDGGNRYVNIAPRTNNRKTALSGSNDKLIEYAVYVVIGIIALVLLGLVVYGLYLLALYLIAQITLFIDKNWVILLVIGIVIVGIIGGLEERRR
jgi:5-methylcytosine-specific restriction endonuclease McrA